MTLASQSSPTPPRGISFAIAEPAGFLDDMEVTIGNIAWCRYNYGGTVDHDILALGVTWTDDNGKEYDQFYSAGEKGLTWFAPSDDQDMLIPLGSRQTLVDSCNAWVFLKSVLEAGERAGKQGQVLEVLGSGRIRPLIGLRAYVRALPQPKREGLKLIRGGQESDREKTIVVVDQILAMPGEQPVAAVRTAQPGQAPGHPPAPKPAMPPAPKAAAGKPGPKGPVQVPTAQAAQAAQAPVPPKANGQAAAAEADNVAMQAMQVLMAIVGNGPIAKKDLPTKAFQACIAVKMDNKLSQQVVQLLFKDAFLHEQAQAGLITYDGTTLTQAGS